MKIQIKSFHLVWTYTQSEWKREKCVDIGHGNQIPSLIHHNIIWYMLQNSCIAVVSHIIRSCMLISSGHCANANANANGNGNANINLVIDAICLVYSQYIVEFTCFNNIIYMKFNLYENALSHSHYALILCVHNTVFEGCKMCGANIYTYLRQFNGPKRKTHRRATERKIITYTLHSFLCDSNIAYT